MTSSTDNKSQRHHSRTPLRFLVFSASLRKDSLNSQLANHASNLIEKHGATVDRADMKSFDCPSFDGDLEIQEGIAKGAVAFRNRLLANDAFIIASPEYNGSMPGLLKNTIDWTSRFRPQPFNEMHGMLMSASPSMAGGNKALWSLRMPFEHLGARIFPDMFSLAVAHKAFNDDGTLVNQVLETRFEETLVAFMNLVEAAKNYPCIKKAWVEFLGEQPDPATDRVEI